MTSSFEDRLGAVRQRIRLSAEAMGRSVESIRLIAVSKTQTVPTMITAYRCGVRDFAESYVQEAVAKQVRLGHFDITWHFVGPIQSNKTRFIAARFNWVHSVDRIKIAERLSEQRPSNLPPLNVCIQINVSGESTKSGIDIESVSMLAEAIISLPRLRLRGVMAVPEPTSDRERQRAVFHSLRQLFELYSDFGWDDLSMGMSEDFEAAILEGSTMVRIGTALFGPRSR